MSTSISNLLAPQLTLEHPPKQAKRDGKNLVDSLLFPSEVLAGVVVDAGHGKGSLDDSNVQQAQTNVMAGPVSGVQVDPPPDNPLVPQSDKSASLSLVHADDNINFSGNTEDPGFCLTFGEDSQASVQLHGTIVPGVPVNPFWGRHSDLVLNCFIAAPVDNLSEYREPGAVTVNGAGPLALQK